MAELKIDWASYKSAKYACENWHYSGVIPVGKLVKVGVWEDGKFIGVVLFGRGANNNLGKAFNLRQDQICELVRVALKAHETPVTRVVSIAIKFLKKSNDGLRLIVSYADSGQGHYGIIYQAGNWVYDLSSTATSTMINGVKYHNKSVHSKYGFNGLQRLLDAGINAKHIKDSPKFRYLMPLDKKMRRKIKSLSKPYPKRPGSVDSCTVSSQDKSGGANPTPGLNYG